MASEPNATTVGICENCTTIRSRQDDLNNTTNPTSIHLETTTSTTTVKTTVIWSPETTTTDITLETEADTANQNISRVNATALNLNATRHCDDCVEGEVCVALVTDEVPICRTGPDPEDPTGCAGLCTINTQRCHRLDVDAFR